LLYASWQNRDSLLVTKQEFTNDLTANYHEMKKHGLNKEDAFYFLPPYEWYNDSISKWTGEMEMQLINYSPGTLSHADYTKPSEKNYRSSQTIYNSIVEYENKSSNGLKGFILLLHIGTDKERTDKFYYKLPQLLDWLLLKNYQPLRVDELLNHKN
jgi:peptidoglycan/xylan/chitin deacetylase (PgdA/CDA1 family)